jgi:hypothetical protein
MTLLRGVIHGKTIELESEPGLPDGEVVSVIVERSLPPGEGIRQSAGAWADAGEELDAWLQEVRKSRERGRAEPLPSANPRSPMPNPR